MPNAEYWIKQLELEAHPEGGFFRETYRSANSYEFGESTPFQGPGNHATAIHYLLRTRERSRLHRIHSDELWFYHAGAPLCLHIFPETGEPSLFMLGPNPEHGEVLQAVTPAESWFGACHTQESARTAAYTLVSCVVAPGFEFPRFFLCPQGTAS